MGNKINKNGNAYTFVYAIVLVLVVATLLALCATWLKPFQKQNIEAEAKAQILSTVGITTPKGQNVQQFVQSAYDRYIVEHYAVNNQGSIINGIDAFEVNLAIEQTKQAENRKLPIFKAIINNGEAKYIIPVRGKGLWGAIWGYIALNDDFSQIAGVRFDHKSETPGLGAEIASANFQEQFIGKLIIDDNHRFVSISVVKNGIKGNIKHTVDAISGSTIASNGVEDMLRNCLKLYQPYFTKVNEEKARAEQAAIRAAFVADSIKAAQLAAEEEAQQKILRAIRRRQRAIRDSIAASQAITDSLIAK